MRNLAIISINDKNGKLTCNVSDIKSRSLTWDEVIVSGDEGLLCASDPQLVLAT